MNSVNTDTGHLQGVPQEKYAEIWCALNAGDWHPSVKDRPANLDSMTFEAKHQFIWPILAEIIETIGLKECLREWNKRRA